MEVCLSKTLSCICVLFCFTLLFFVLFCRIAVFFSEQSCSLNSSFFKKHNSSENIKTKSRGVCDVKYTMISVKKRLFKRGKMDYSVLSLTLQGSSTVSPS